MTVYCISSCSISSKPGYSRTTIPLRSPCSQPQKLKEGEHSRSIHLLLPRGLPSLSPPHTAGHAWPERQDKPAEDTRERPSPPSQWHFQEPPHHPSLLLTQRAGSDGRQVIAPSPWRCRTPPASSDIGSSRCSGQVTTAGPSPGLCQGRSVAPKWGQEGVPENSM